jgi:hypothetical protein
MDIGNSWFKLRTLKEVFDAYAHTTERFDLTKYDNRGLRWISALLRKEDVGHYPRVHTVPALAYRSYIFQKNRKAVPLDSPVTIKALAKLRSTEFVPSKSSYLWSNSDTYSWYVTRRKHRTHAKKYRLAMALWLQDSSRLDNYAVYPNVPKEIAVPTAYNLTEEEEAAEAFELSQIDFGEGAKTPDHVGPGERGPFPPM